MDAVTAEHEQLAYPPKSDKRTDITQLAYLHSFDGVQDKDYVCLVYKEQSTKTGQWKLKVDLKGARVSVINPESSSLRRNLAKAASAGEEYLVTGYRIEPSAEDPRLLETRLFFNDMAEPEYLEVHLATRESDGSAGDRQIAVVDWPDGERADENTRFVALPRSTFSHKNEELAYIHAYDVIANHDYAYLAYKRTHLKSGKWEVRIRGNGTSGASVDPEDGALQKKMQAAADEGKDHIIFGSPLATNDARMAENRLYFDGSLHPSRVEIHLVTRKADGSANEAEVASFPWPAGR